METDIKRIMVIGNGFDLAHQLPTRYNDFMIFIEEAGSNINNRLKRQEDIDRAIELRNTIKKNIWYRYYRDKRCYINSWTDFEKELLPALRFFCYLFESKRTIDEKYEIDEDYRLQLFTEEHWQIARIFEKEFFECERNNSSIIIRKEYWHKVRGLLKEEIRKSLWDEFDSFVKCFGSYLTLISDNYEVIRHPSISKIEADVIMNFNYTNTIQYYDNLKDAKTYCIHGSIDNLESLVMGVNDIGEEDSSMEFCPFVKYFQRLSKDLDLGYRKYILEDKSINTVFWGHALDVIDADIIKPLLVNSNKVQIFYCDNVDREKKIINLLKMLGRDEIEKRMYMNSIELKKIN